jgi:NADPH2:quinone reductase
MQAIIVNQFGGPEQLHLQEMDAPGGDIIVQATWAGVNFVDIYQREGRYPGVKQPWPMGIEGTGIIAKTPVGSSWKVGERVAYSTDVQGSYAELVAVPAANLVRVPDDVSLRDACAAIEHGLTAIMLVDDVARLPISGAESGSVLVHAAAGGVGAKLQAHAAAVFRHIADGTVQVRIHATYPLADAALAHSALAERGTQGKLLLSINPKIDS